MRFFCFIVFTMTLSIETDKYVRNFHAEELILCRKDFQKFRWNLEQEE